MLQVLTVGNCLQHYSCPTGNADVPRSYKGIRVMSDVL